MQDFKERLRKAAERGRQASDAKAEAAAAEALSEEESRRRHGAYRRELTDHIETCLHQLVETTPGFGFEPVMSEKGWGGAVTRDDLSLNRGKRESHFSRLVFTVSPFGKYGVLELVAKGTIRNKEAFSRNHYRLLAEVDIEEFRGLVEQWTVEYAEQYAATGH